jgi:hypothetical protein
VEALDLMSLVVDPLGKPPSLSNPLRLRKVSDRIGAELFPNLSVYTRRAKYFGLILHWADLRLLSSKNNNDRLDALTVAAEMFYGHPQAAVSALVGSDIFRPLYAGIATGDLPPCNKIIAINSFSMYRNSLRALRLLHPNDELTDRGKELLATLQFPNGSAYKESLQGYVKRGGAFPSKLRHHLKTWTLRGLPLGFKVALREMVGLPGRKRAEDRRLDDAPKVRNQLGPLMRYLRALKVDEQRRFERLASGSIQEIFKQRQEADGFLKRIGWQRAGANRHLRSLPLEDLYRHDRILFFLLAVFETMRLAVLHGGAGAFNISRLAPSADGNASADRCRRKLLDHLKRIENARGDKRGLKVRRDECSNLFSLAWTGLDQCRAAFPTETAAVLASIGERLPLSNFAQAVLKGSYKDATLALIELHIHYSRSRDVEPLVACEDSHVTLVNPDVTWLPDLGRDGQLFGYRIQVMCDFLGDVL